MSNRKLVVCRFLLLLLHLATKEMRLFSSFLLFTFLFILCDSSLCPYDDHPPIPFPMNTTAPPFLAYRPKMLLCVITNRKEWRDTWRAHAINRLSKVGIDTLFFEGTTPPTIELRQEQAKYNDMIFLNVTEGGFKGFQLRSILTIQWAIDKTDYDWVVRADDDCFFCPHGMRRAIDMLPLDRALHWSHYTPQRGKLVSDAYALYNRLGAKLWLKYVGPDTIPFGYMDVADEDPDMWVINDVRFAFGLGVEFRRSQFDPSCDWGHGQVFLPLTRPEIHCFCEDMLAVHITTKDHKTFAALDKHSRE